MPTKYWYNVEIFHEGLGKSKIIRANTRKELEYKEEIQIAQWEEQYQRKLTTLKLRGEREQKAKNTERALGFAKLQTEYAEKKQKDLDCILVHSLDLPVYDFEKLKDFSPYSEKCPAEPVYVSLLREPDVTDEEFNPKPGFLTKLSKNKLQQFKQDNINRFNEKHGEWVENENKIEEENRQIKLSYEKAVGEWNEAKNEFIKKQNEKNESIDVFKDNVALGENTAVANYIELTLNTIDVPLDFIAEYEVEYDNDSKRAIVDVTLPTIEIIPTLKSVLYVKTKSEYKETYYSADYIKKKYDSVIYQIILVILNMVFKIGEKYNIIESTVVNGKIHTVDKATGKEINPYILSVTVSKNDFNELNLQEIDPKAWFKNAKGVSAAALAKVTPIAPIVTMSKDDDRFIEGYEVADKLNESVNLAAMDWRDFENLIREVFEQEFNSSGGEVKITQASRDGGVDAVAFDPDPIRGGKIVIQAKRYTNVVGVSAVRDLYGTLMNEGAMKGILVTTSNYGNDAYEFAKGKPLQLVNGANLLSLLEKHGHKARINIKEAKAILQDS